MCKTNIVLYHLKAYIHVFFLFFIVLNLLTFVYFVNWKVMSRRVFRIIYLDEFKFGHSAVEATKHQYGLGGEQGDKFRGRAFDYLQDRRLYHKIYWTSAALWILLLYPPQPYKSCFVLLSLHLDNFGFAYKTKKY